MNLGKVLFSQLSVGDPGSCGVEKDGNSVCANGCAKLMVVTSCFFSTWNYLML